jgi:cation transport ATPase
MPTSSFREVIRPPLWLILFIYLMLFSIVVAIWAAFDNRSAAVSALIAIAVGVILIFSTKGEITFDGHELRVGKAHIEQKYCGSVTVLNRSEFLRARTRGIDPAAHLALLFWVSQGVKIEINDSRDPTPYWLISTRRGEELKRALAR